MSKDKAKFGGINADAAYRPEKTVEVAASQILQVIRGHLQTAPDDYWPLMPISCASLLLTRRVAEMLRDDAWIAENAVIVCFDNTNGLRHVAAALAKDRDFWESDPRAKRHLKTLQVSVYDPGQFAEAFLPEIDKEIN